MRGRCRTALAAMVLCWCWNTPGELLRAGEADSPSAPASQSSSTTAGGYESKIDLSLEAVFVDTDGSRNKFWTERYVRPGFNTAGLHLDLRPQKGVKSFFNFLTLSASGVGDSSPYQVTNFRMAKRGLYDVRAAYRKYDYFFALPEFALGLHSENSVNRSGNVSLKLFPDRKVSFLLGYRRYQLYGTRFSSQNLMLDTYPVSFPRRLASNEYRAGASLNWRPLSLSFDQSFIRFRDDAQVFPNSRQPEGFRGNLLESGQRDMPTRISTPVSRVFVRYAPGNRYQLAGRYMYSGADMNINRYENFLQRTGGTLFPVRQIISSSGTSEKPTHNAGLTQNLELTNRLTLHHRFVYETYTLTGLLDTTGLLRLINAAAGQKLDFPFADAGGTVTDYRLARNETELQYAVASSFSLVGGHRYSDRHLAFGARGANPRPVVTITNAGNGGIIWIPSAKGRLRAEFEKGTASEAFNRTDPLSFQRWKLRGLLRPLARLTISGSALFEDNRNDTTGVNRDLNNRQFGIQAVYVPATHYAFSGGYSFYRIHSITDIVFYTLTELTNGVSAYETNTHSIHGMVEFPVGSRVELRAGYEYLNDTGKTFPLKMHIPRVGISIKLRRNFFFETAWQHYSYNERLFSIRDYRANVLRTGLRFTY